MARARDAAIGCVRDAFAAGRPARLGGRRRRRRVIEDAGYGPYFVHRTGHNIGQETHGNGANMDNLETHEERLVLPRTCFSIEPGIYRAEFGVRSEINVYVAAARSSPRHRRTPTARRADPGGGSAPSLLYHTPPMSMSDGCRATDPRHFIRALEQASGSMVCFLAEGKLTRLRFGRAP